MTLSRRTTRIVNRLRALPALWWRLYPEQVAAYIAFGIPATCMLFYKFSTYGFDGGQPYYRGIYDIVRPDHPAALNWRVPEDYPADYLSNRENEKVSTYKRDYGWKSVL